MLYTYRENGGILNLTMRIENEGKIENFKPDEMSKKWYRMQVLTRGIGWISDRLRLREQGFKSIGVGDPDFKPDDVTKNWLKIRKEMMEELDGLRGKIPMREGICPDDEPIIPGKDWWKQFIALDEMQHFVVIGAGGNTIYDDGVVGFIDRCQARKSIMQHEDPMGVSIIQEPTLNSTRYEHDFMPIRNADIDGVNFRSFYLSERSDYGAIDTQQLWARLTYKFVAPCNGKLRYCYDMNFRARPHTSADYAYIGVRVKKLFHKDGDGTNPDALGEYVNLFSFEHTHDDEPAGQIRNDLKTELPPLLPWGYTSIDNGEVAYLHFAVVVDMSVERGYANFQQYGELAQGHLLLRKYQWDDGSIEQVPGVVFKFDPDDR